MIFDYAAFSVIFLIAAVAGGLVLLYFGGEWLTKGAVAIALHFRVSALVVGLTVVSMSTSAPEMITSLISAWTGSPGIALGNILGSNLANVGLILALALIIAPSSSRDPLLRSEVLILIAVTLLFFILSFIGGVSRLDGFILIFITVAYLIYIVRRSRRQPPSFAQNLEEEVEEAEVSMPIAIVAIIAGTVALAAGADLLVGASAEAAHRLGVSDFVIGITIVAVGTSLPELATTLAAAARKQTGIILGNIIGSNFFNIVLIGGALGILVPISVDPAWLRFEFPAMIFLTALLWVFVSMNRQVRRWEGAILLVLYVAIILTSTASLSGKPPTVRAAASTCGEPPSAYSQHPFLMTTKPTVLIIRDGWGENHDSSHASFNAVLQACTPVSDRLSKEWPRTELLACGRDVGLPDGIMGNSEVGHQNIGAGRIVDQELVRIDKAFETGSVDANPQIEAIFAHLQKTGGRLHLMGLVSDAGVHAMLEHLYGLLGVCKRRQFHAVYVHAFTDGRDTPPFSGKSYIEAAEAKIREIGVGKLASVAGRFWAMDRDLRWDRVQTAYDALTGRAAKFTAHSATEAVEFAYKNPIDDARKGDEFVVPTMVVDESGKPVGIIRDGDAVIFFNFRGDRPRELTRAFIEENFDGFDRGARLDIHYATMTNYQKGLCPNVIFDKPPKMPDILGAWVAAKGIRQFRCAETEKFPHVTFFFNDYREEPFEGEDREMLQSPKEVSTYDQKPEMAALGVKEATKQAILSGKYGLIVVNFANADMVGHTGVFEAAVKACEVVDAAVGELLEAVDRVGGSAVITADHGNSDQMWDPDGNGAHTAHTLNPVELVVYGEGLKGRQLKSNGRLADIAPTILALMGLDKPRAMTGDNLLQG